MSVKKALTINKKDLESAMENHTLNKFDYAIQEGPEVFDWKEEVDAKVFETKWKTRGCEIVDLGEGSDTYVLLALKPGIKVAGKKEGMKKEGMKKVGLRVGDIVKYIGNDERYKKWLTGKAGRVIEVPHVIVRVDFGIGFSDVPLSMDSVKVASTKKGIDKEMEVIEKRNPRIAAEITKVLEEIIEPEPPKDCKYPEIWYHARERVRESGEPVIQSAVKKVFDDLIENLSSKEAYLTPPSWVKQPEIWNNVMRMLEIKGPVDYGAAVAYYKNKCKKMNLVAGEVKKIAADLTNQQLRDLFKGKDRGFFEEAIVALYNKFPTTRWTIENYAKVACKKMNLAAKLSPRELAKKAK